MGDVSVFLSRHDDNFRRARLPSLYSDFRSQQTLNPDGFHANVSAWRAGLARAAWEGLLGPGGSQTDHLLVSVNERLLRALEHREFGRPLAVGTVLREAIASKDFIPVQDFLRTKGSIHHQSWLNLPRSVITWLFGQVWSTDGPNGDEKLPSGRFVVVKNVDLVTKVLADHAAGISSLFDRVFTRAHFYKQFRAGLVDGIEFSETDVDVLLKYACEDKGILVYDGKTIKFQYGIKDGSGITEDDAAISSLKELLMDLRQQTVLMRRQVEGLAVQAKEAVARGNKVAAVAALKSKKLAEASLETRYATLSQLEQVASKIEQAADNVQLVKAMESASGVLRSLNQQAGGAESVQEVMDSIRERMGEVDEIGNVIASFGNGTTVLGEGDIDDELVEMELQENGRLEDDKETGEMVEAAVKRAREEEAAATMAARLPQIPNEQLDSERQVAVPSKKSLEGSEMGASPVLGKETLASQTADGIGRLSVQDVPQHEPQLAN